MSCRVKLAEHNYRRRVNSATNKRKPPYAEPFYPQPIRPTPQGSLATPPDSQVTTMPAAPAPVAFGGHVAEPADDAKPLEEGLPQEGPAYAAMHQGTPLVFLCCIRVYIAKQYFLLVIRMQVK